MRLSKDEFQRFLCDATAEYKDLLRGVDSGAISESEEPEQVEGVDVTLQKIDSVRDIDPDDGKTCHCVGDRKLAAKRAYEYIHNVPIEIVQEYGLSLFAAIMAALSRKQLSITTEGREWLWTVANKNKSLVILEDGLYFNKEMFYSHCTEIVRLHRGAIFVGAEDFFWMALCLANILTNLTKKE